LTAGGSFGKIGNSAKTLHTLETGKNMAKLRLLGDCHGRLDDYIEICKDAENQGLLTLQLGDLHTSEFAVPYIKLKLPNWKDYHRYLFGNHDFHPNRSDMCLGDWGWIDWGYKIFYLSGGFSIDWEYRQKHMPGTWHPEEELSSDSLRQAVQLYEGVKPDLVLSHEAPREVANMIGNPSFLRNWGYDPETFTTRTSETLQAMFEIHKPKAWYFGHFHVSKKLNLHGTDFQCLKELEYVDI